ncbi:SMC family ATPase, partial [Georgenia sp. 10Sc9-8]|nr:SMC family ATPase [Georgenia halotolerans]
MRVHRLTFQAIGPFPDRHTIDVDRLSAGGLFLLEGPTGAGKSTIIDAVVFALYGQVAGADASEDRLHSDHADPGVEPFVEMVFSTAAGSFRVWRSPKHERPKQRGTGTVTQNSRAKLWQLSSAEDEAGQVLSAHVQEVGGELGRIVALDRAQFTQTVVLPQGQFAAFLRARPEDRRTVLQEVFGTEVYERVQQQLAEMAKEARAGLAGAAGEVGSAAAAFVQAAALPEDDALRAPLCAAATERDTAVLSTLSQEVCARSAAAADAAAAAEQGARAAERAAQGQLDEQRDLAARLSRRATLIAEQGRLDARAAEVRAVSEELAGARRATAVTAALRARQTAVERHDRALARLVEGAGLVPEMGATAPAELGPRELAALGRLVEQCTDERGGLAELLSVEAGLPARAAALVTEQREVDAATDHVEQRRTELAARPARRAELDAEVAAAARQAATLPGLRAAQETAADRLVGAELAVERAAALARAADTVQQAAAAARAAADTEHALRRRWVDGMASELAGGLRADEPCPVCGSAEHPAPATPAPQHVTAEQVEHAALARQRAEEQLAAARTEHARTEEQLTAARAAAHGQDPDQARAAVESCRRAVSETEDAVRRTERLTTELAGFDEETAHLAEAVGTLSRDLATATERLANARRQLTADRERCAQAAGDHATVTDRAAELAAQLTAAKELEHRLDERLAAAGALADAEELLAESLTEAGFADAEAARRAARTPQQVHQLDRVLHQHAADVERVATGLAEEGVAELTGQERADVTAAERAHHHTQQALTEATRRCAAAQSCAQQSADARRDLVGALDRHGTQAAAAAPVLRMAALANATEGSATTLATFVLLQRFEDVVAAANERLSMMSDGRYSLERIDTEGGQRSRKAGLGLQVRDHVTETPRDP